MKRAALILAGSAAGLAAWYALRPGALFIPSMNEPMKTSAAGLELIKQFEGFRSTVYDANPPHQDLTIGYGHKLRAGESFPDGITRAAALELLALDVARVGEARVKRDIQFEVNQAQFDALVSLAFNLTWRSWQLAAARLNAGQDPAAVFLLYVYGSGVKLPGLVIRRRRELALFNSQPSQVLA